jgi:hypothetical protein
MTVDLHDAMKRELITPQKYYFSAFDTHHPAQKFLF